MTKTAIKFVYFDVGNVLLVKEVESEYEVYAKTLNVQAETIEKIFSNLYLAQTLESKFLDETFRNIRNFKDEIEYFTLKHVYLLKQLGHSDIDLSLVKKLNEASFWLLYRQRKLNENTVEILNYLKSKNYSLGVLSNAFPGRPEFDMKPLGITKYFSEFIISAVVGHRKPDPEIYKIAIEKSKHKPSEIAFIDDKLENLEAAQKLGFGLLFWYNHFKESNVKIPEGIVEIGGLGEVKRLL